MNRARQDAITTEIMEIIGGAEALADDRGDAEDLLLDHLVLGPLPATSRPRPPHRRPRPADVADRPSDAPRTRIDHRPGDTMTVTEPELKDGRIVAIAGPVVDVEFPPAPCPRSTPPSSSRSASTARRSTSSPRWPSRSVTAGSVPSR